jgi:predicted esterase
MDICAMEQSPGAIHDTNDQETRARSINLNFHGTNDTTVPFENAERFTRLMNEAGNDCELVTIDGVGHGFFNGDFFREGYGNKYSS